MCAAGWEAAGLFVTLAFKRGGEVAESVLCRMDRNQTHMEPPSTLPSFFLGCQRGHTQKARVCQCLLWTFPRCLSQIEGDKKRQGGGGGKNEKKESLLERYQTIIRDSSCGDRWRFYIEEAESRLSSPSIDWNLCVRVNHRLLCGSESIVICKT